MRSREAGRGAGVAKQDREMRHRRSRQYPYLRERSGSRSNNPVPESSRSHVSRAPSCTASSPRQGRATRSAARELSLEASTSKQSSVAAPREGTHQYNDVAAVLEDDCLAVAPHTTILPAGGFNHLIALRANCFCDEAFRDTDRAWATRTRGGSRASRIGCVPCRLLDGQPGTFLRSDLFVSCGCEAVVAYYLNLRGQKGAGHDRIWQMSVVLEGDLMGGNGDDKG